MSIDTALKIADSLTEEYEVQELINEQLSEILSNQEREHDLYMERSFRDFKYELFEDLMSLSVGDSIENVLNWSKLILIEKDEKWLSRVTNEELKRMEMFLRLNNEENLPEVLF